MVKRGKEGKERIHYGAAAVHREGDKEKCRNVKRTRKKRRKMEEIRLRLNHDLSPSHLYFTRSFIPTILLDDYG